MPPMSSPPEVAASAPPCRTGLSGHEVSGASSLKPLSPHLSCTHTRKHTRACTHTGMHMHAHRDTDVDRHVHTSPHTQTCTTRTCTCMPAHVHRRVCTQTHVHTQRCVHMYAHTHILVLLFPWAAQTRKWTWNQFFPSSCQWPLGVPSVSLGLALGWRRWPGVPAHREPCREQKPGSAGPWEQPWLGVTTRARGSHEGSLGALQHSTGGPCPERGQ